MLEAARWYKRVASSTSCEGGGKALVLFLCRPATCTRSRDTLLNTCTGTTSTVQVDNNKENNLLEIVYDDSPKPAAGEAKKHRKEIVA